MEGEHCFESFFMYTPHRSSTTKNAGVDHRKEIVLYRAISFMTKNQVCTSITCFFLCFFPSGVGLDDCNITLLKVCG